MPLLGNIIPGWGHQDSYHYQKYKFILMDIDILVSAGAVVQCVSVVVQAESAVESQ